MREASPTLSRSSLNRTIEGTAKLGTLASISPAMRSCMTPPHGRGVEHYAQSNYDAGAAAGYRGRTRRGERQTSYRAVSRRGLPPIPDWQFDRLKRPNLRKVVLSKRLDEDPWMGVSHVASLASIP
jgi:hypothetical protein